MENNENKSEDRQMVEDLVMGIVAVLVAIVIFVVGTAAYIMLSPYAARAESVQAQPGRPVKHILPACPSDEGEQIGPCVWIGTVDGNQTGRSFRVRVNPHDHLLPGKIDYIPDWRARMLRGYPYAVSPYGTTA